MMLDDRLWQAILSCSPEYDGKLYYAVKTTGIFCHFSCNSKTPRRQNVRIFESVEEAIAAGFRPCKRCRPDLGPFYDPDAQLIRTACHIFESGFANPRVGEEVPSRLGISPFHFQRLFKRHTGLTPKEYLTGVRIARAQDLLGKPGLTTMAVAFDTGFRSLSAFYATFRRVTGDSPREYLARKREEDN